MIGLGIKVDLRQAQRALGDTGKQVAFATSLGLNALAKGVAADERATVDQTFKTPTPFTENAFRVVVATKSRPIATIAMKDIQAAYLAPYVKGGERFLGTKRGMLAPRAVGLNKYGNLTKGKMASLKAKRGVYIGPIKTKAGKTINGVWQRPTGNQATGGLKLLIQFEDTTQVRKRLPFEQRARAYVARHAAREMNAALVKALAGARR